MCQGEKRTKKGGRECWKREFQCSRVVWEALAECTCVVSWRKGEVDQWDIREKDPAGRG